MEKKVDWGVKCEILSCKKRKRLHPYLKFFKFPARDSENFAKWIEACHLPELPKAKNAYVCSDHFKSESFGKKYLRKGALPSLFIDEAKTDCEFEHIPVLFSGKCYGNPSLKNTGELLLEDLAVLEPPPINMSNNLEIEDNFCRNCLKLQKKFDFSQNKYNNLLKKYLLLKSKMTKILTLKRKSKFRQTFLKNVLKSDRKNSLKNKIDSCDTSPEAKTFSKMILFKRSKSKIWKPKEKILAQNLHFKSPATYKFLRNYLKMNLPSISSIYRWSPIKKLKPGLNSNLTENLKNIIKEWDNEKRECILIFDEIAIKRELSYDSTNDEIVGFKDMGLTRSKELGKNICVFMVRGIFSNYKFVITYYVIGKGSKGCEIKEALLENLDYCEKLGVNVCAIVCDQGPNNRCCFKKLGVEENKSYFFHNNKKYYAMYDSPHLIKSLRNTLISTDIQCKDGIVSWECVREIFNLERTNATKMCTKLSSNHVNPDKWKKMKVSLAVQVFSRSCSAAIKTALHCNLFSNETALKSTSTASFFEKINNLFDCLNSNQKFNPNIYKSSLTKDGRVQNYLADMLDYLNKIYFPGISKVCCISGLRQTIKAILEISNNLFDKYPHITYILTRKFQQDPLENLFSIIRSKGGCNTNPSVMDFSRTLSKIMANKVLSYSSEFSNCEDDTDNFVFWDNLEFVQGENINSDETQMQIDISNNRNECSVNPLNIEEIIYSINDITDNTLCERASLRYYVGFIAFKNLKKFNCNTCNEIIRKNGEIISFTCNTESLIYFKNYCGDTDFGRLNAPSDLFYDICYFHLQIFKNIIGSTPELKCLKETIVNLCISETKKHFECHKWFCPENPCYDHHIKILDSFILTLIKKYCIWKSRDFITLDKEEKNIKKRQKLNILQS